MGKSVCQHLLSKCLQTGEPSRLSLWQISDLDHEESVGVDFNLGDFEANDFQLSVILFELRTG